MHNGDIRSCLNALQVTWYIKTLSSWPMFSDAFSRRWTRGCSKATNCWRLRAGKMKRLSSIYSRTSTQDCNMSSGLFDVWNATFKLAAKQDQKQGGNYVEIRTKQDNNFSVVKHMDLHKLLNFHSSSMTTILLGLFCLFYFLVCIPIWFLGNRMPTQFPKSEIYRSKNAQGQ